LSDSRYGPCSRNGREPAVRLRRVRDASAGHPLRLWGPRGGWYRRPRFGWRANPPVNPGALAPSGKRPGRSHARPKSIARTAPRPAGWRPNALAGTTAEAMDPAGGGQERRTGNRVQLVERRTPKRPRRDEDDLAGRWTSTVTSPPDRVGPRSRSAWRTGPKNPRVTRNALPPKPDAAPRRGGGRRRSPSAGPKTLPGQRPPGTCGPKPASPRRHAR
jgi:hypothetical protein